MVIVLTLSTIKNFTTEHYNNKEIYQEIKRTKPNIQLSTQKKRTNQPTKDQLIYLSINQPTNKPINQPTNQPVNESKPTNQQIIDQSTNEGTNKPIIEPNNKQANKPTIETNKKLTKSKQPTKNEQSMEQPTNEQINQPTKVRTNKQTNPTNQSIEQLLQNLITFLPYYSN